MARKRFTKHIKIPSAELREYENLLISTNVDYDQEKISEYSTIKKWTVHFPDGCFADIKVNSNSRESGDFFSEAVLFDENGSQLDFSEAAYDIRGKWNLSSRDTDYTVYVKAE